MGIRGSRSRVGVALAVALVAAACSGEGSDPATPTPSSATAPTTVMTSTPTPTAAPATDCEGLAVQIVDALQDYVDTFGASTADEVPAVAADAGSDLSTAVEDLRGRAETLGCDAATMEPLVATELERLAGSGPVQQAVVDTLRADPLGSADPSDPRPVDVEVATSEQLVAAVATVGSGSTIRLTATTYDLDAALVLLRPVTLVGAGRDRTVLRSSASGAAVIAASDGDVELGDLAVEHIGDEPASVIVVNGGGHDLHDLAVRGGRADSQGVGGYGIVLRPTPSMVGGASRQVVRDVTVDDTDGGGVVVGSDAAPDLRAVTVTGPGPDGGGCGLCWIEQATGTVTGARVSDRQVGLRIDDDAAPTITDSTVVDTGVGVAVTGAGDPSLADNRIVRGATGMELAGSGSPEVRGTEVRDSSDLGIRISGTATPRLARTVVTGPSAAGIAVVDQAEPTLHDDAVATTGDVAVLWGGRATGTARGLVVQSARVGFQLGDDSNPSLVDLAARGVGEVALIATGSSAGSLDGMTCDDTDAGLVVLTESTTLEVLDSDCEVVEQRDEPDEG